MKREYQGDDYFTHNKKPKSDTFGEAIAAGKYQLRLLISSKSAGALIGKKGDNIKRLRSQYDAQVGVGASSAPERTISLTAARENILPLFEDLLSRLEDTNEHGKREVRLLVHQSQAGSLIGRGGSKIKELREKSGSQMKIYQTPAPQSTDRVCLVTGDDSSIVNAVYHIVDQLQGTEIRGSSSNYDTCNYVAHYASEYGGLPIEDFRVEQPRKIIYQGGDYNPQIMRGGTAGTSFGGIQQMQQAMQQMPIPHPPPSPLTSNYGHQPPPGQLMLNQVFGGQDGLGNHGCAGFGNMNPEIRTDQVTIPANFGGAIIGKSGQRIRQIREESGASILVEPLSERDQRVITITGSLGQIQHAQYLLQNAVRASNEGRLHYADRAY